MASAERTGTVQLSLAELMKQLKDDAVALIKSELRLFFIALKGRALELRSVLPLAIGGLLVAHLGLLALAGALVLAIAEALDGNYALSATLVGAGLLLAGGVALVATWRLVKGALKDRRLPVPGEAVVEVIHDRTGE